MALGGPQNSDGADDLEYSHGSSSENQPLQLKIDILGGIHSLLLCHDHLTYNEGDKVTRHKHVRHF
jgi:hypothetical protein